MIKAPMKTIRLFTALACIPFLISCGGGGDSGCTTGLGALGGLVCGSSTPNTAPVANAGLTQNVSVGTLVTLNGSLSRDADNEPLTYIWQLTTKPNNSLAAITSVTSAAPQFTADLAGTYTITLIVNDGKVSSPVSSVTVVASVTNSIPVANAGMNQNVQLGTTITLDGTASTDANSDTLSYKWTMYARPATSTASLSSTTSPNPKFTADVMGIYTIALVVNDGKVDSAPVPVTVVASNTNSAPVANAGSAQSVVAGTAVTLDGTSSSDANSDPLTFKWYWGTKPSGSSAALSSDTSAKPTFTADKGGTYVLTLIVNDGKANSEISAVTITASVANAAPVGNAGINQNVTLPAIVTLDGSASSDANRDPLTYKWALVTKPTGSLAALSSTNSAKPTFTADIAGSYVASLIVNDGLIDSTVTTTTVTAAVANSAPVANAGTNQNVTVGTLTTLDGSASTDADRDALTYTWTLLSKPTSSTATLSSTNSPKPTFTPDLAGAYVTSLVVNDSKVTSSTVAVTVTASTANSAPVANAGTNPNVTVGALTTLDGSASTDADRDALTYTWTLMSKPMGRASALSSTFSPKPTFTPDVAGSYSATLIVNDGKVSSFPTVVSVTASAANSAPVANAGINQNVTLPAIVTLDGSASSDANRDPLTYKWALVTKPTGSLAALSSTNSAKPTFTADIAGSYVASLIVNDGLIDSTVTTTTVTAAVANSAPVANAGTNQNVTVGTLTTLDGSASTDADRDALTYTWTLLSKPTSSTATLSSTNSPKPTFTPDLAGAYVTSLVVNDSKVTSSTVAVTVTASTANSAPVANAGTNQSVTTGAVVTLNGSGSTDANNNTLTYLWTWASKPTSSTAALSSAATASPTFTADLAGTYVANLVVNDGIVNSSNVGSVTITASNLNSAPVANAGTAQTVARVNGTITVNLIGTGSTDANNDPLTYKWTIAYQPTGSTATLSSATASSPTFTATVAGVYVFSLVVNDGKVDSSAVASVSITVS